ncbi:unnamed protein product, partial [Didymodactylos carnosus]
MNLIIYDDINSTLYSFDQLNNFLELNISFKPSNIYISPYQKNLWLANDESNEPSTLYASENGGEAWKKLENGVKFLAWSSNDNIYISNLNQVQLIHIPTLEQIDKPIYENLATSNFLSKYFIITDLDNNLEIRSMNNMNDTLLLSDKLSSSRS